MKGTAVKQCPDFAVWAGFRQHVQLFLCPFILSRKAEQLKEEATASGV
jgi:hypothetical protein